MGQRLVGSFCVISGHQSTLQQALAEHVVILDALATGRPAAARKAMTTHIISGLAAVLTTLADDQPK